MINITEEEKKVVEELKRRTISDVTPKMLEDVSLFYRFAKARDFNLVEAETMLKKHIAWRKEFQIDTILTDYEPPEVLQKYIPTSFICFDNAGTGVTIYDCGRPDTKGLWQVAQLKEIAKYCSFRTEQDRDMVIKRFGHEFGRKIFFLVYDFEGLTYANAVNTKTLQNGIYLLKMFMDNYPESIRKMMVINAPIYFTWMYAVMKPVLPPAVIQKLRIYGTDGWKEALLEEIDADNLPAYLGGNRTDPDGNPFCETFIVRGRNIPKTYYRKNRTKKLSLESDVEKLTVMPFSKEEITFKVNEENSYLEWEFETENRDIDFSLHFKGKYLEDFGHVELIPKQRMDTSFEPEKGYFKCENVGNYTIVFDNSYSWFHSKEVYYKVGIKGQKNNDLYNSAKHQLESF